MRRAGLVTLVAVLSVGTSPAASALRGQGASGEFVAAAQVQRVAADETVTTLVALRRNLMPLPRTIEFAGDPLVLRRDFTVSVSGPASGVAPRVERAVLRMLERLSSQTGIPIPIRLDGDAERAQLRIRYRQAVPELQEAEENETYRLTIDAAGGELRAPTPYGILRGLETFLQLVGVAVPGPVDGLQRSASIAALDPEPDDFVIPGVVINDTPRFPWRGLLIDSGRHFLALDVIKRNLDAMAAVKLNVLHWHLSEDQGFRVESKVFPKLHGLGSDGLYYTQDEIRDVVAYARDRGIRVMPEFDMPGHATSWFVGYPQLASAPGPYEIVDTWGIKDPAMDPTRDETYEFLQAFIAEMAALFPDRYFHIGGDEVNGKQWSANADIQQFIVDNDLVDNHGLQTYFNRRIQPFLVERGKIMMGWDEIFQPGLPRDAVVHSWRGPDGIAAAARAGYRTVLSNGYYIDLSRPAAHHYAIDPLGGPAAELDDDERALVLGGEATMWGEYVGEETVDSRIWPRTAAIAERLWSDASVTEVDDMYRRLEATSRWLGYVGVTHRSSYRPMLERLSAGGSADGLQTLADVLEPIKGYRRGRTRQYSRFTPLNRLVDATRPESVTARRFAVAVDAYLPAGGRPPGDAEALLVTLHAWRDNHPAVVDVAGRSAMLPEAEALSLQLRDAAAATIVVLEEIRDGRTGSATDYTSREAVLAAAEAPHGALQLMVIGAMRRLVEAAGGERD